MRGEHKVGANKNKSVPGGKRGGNSGKTAFTRGKDGSQAVGGKKGGLAIGTQGWVADKIASGDIEGGMSAGQSGTSIFDPVLCEIAYRWFCRKGGTVLDPFAGGSVRGIVASRLGLRYVGIELRAEQIAANKSQLKIAGKIKPEWREGDSRDIGKIAKDVQADLIFSCPPYWNLEVYSEDSRDLSTLGKEAFFAAQAEIIRAAVDRLRPNSFAVWVTSDVRDKDGYYVNLPGRTIDAFEAAGARFYNDGVLVTAVGSLPVRVRKQFTSGRKLGRTHQVVLIFCKGDWRKAVADLGDVEFGAVPGEDGIVEGPPVAPAVPSGPVDVTKFGTPL